MTIKLQGHYLYTCEIYGEREIRCTTSHLFHCIALIHTLNITPSADEDFPKKMQNTIRDHIISTHVLILLTLWL